MTTLRHAVLALALTRGVSRRLTRGLAVGLVLGLGCGAVLLAAPPARAADGPRWLAPVAGPVRVTRGFAPPAHPWLPGHRGVDLAGRVGEPIRAPARAVVSVAGPVAGVLVVAVRHPDGMETTYQPVRAAVRRGQVVRPGQVLGVLVLPGSHCRPAACLHWGLRRGDAYLDPLGMLGPARVRLLPLGGTPPQWAAPLTGGAAAGSVLTWAALASRSARRRRRPPPRGVPSLATARARRTGLDRLRPDRDEVGVPDERAGEGRRRHRQEHGGRPP